MTDWASAISDLQEICLDTFGVPVFYIPSVSQRPELGGRAIQVMGVFDNQRETVSVMTGGGGGGMDAIIPRPMVELRISDLGITPMEEDEVVINDITYRIMDVQPDGHGAVVLVMNRNQDMFA
jgi:hypothetical protein